MPKTPSLRRFLLLVLMAVLIVGAVDSPPSQRLLTEWTSRSPQQVIRYTLRRLEGHPKLEWLAHPALLTAQRHYEREPPPNLPTLGKGQQPTPIAAPGAYTQELKVDTPQSIREALLTATAGTRIIVAPGLYPFNLTLRLRHGGNAAFPIVLTAEKPGSVFFEFGQVEGILVDQPHWVFENLQIRGTCTRHDDCEHAFHVVGAAEHTTIRNNRISDFNAHIKINGFNGLWPDHGLLQHNTLLNGAPRKTTRPVTPIDLVGANAWLIQDNLIKDFAKGDGNKVSYGLFMKGAGENGRIERNLIICSTQNISAPGVRVGLSFGGGGTDPKVCRQDGCRSFEHHNGLAANNVVAHCNDVGIDINHATGIRLIHNTVINTAGIGTRNAPADTELHANLADGGLHAREGTRLYAPAPTGKALAWLEAADRLKLNPLPGTPLVERKPLVTNDFFLHPRQHMTAAGAVDAPL